MYALTTFLSKYFQIPNLFHNCEQLAVDRILYLKHEKFFKILVKSCICLLRHKNHNVLMETKKEKVLLICIW